MQSLQQQNLQQQLNSLDALKRPYIGNPVDRMGMGPGTTTAAPNLVTQAPGLPRSPLELPGLLKRWLRQSARRSQPVRGKQLKRVALGLSVVLSLGVIAGAAAVHQRYGDRALSNLPLFTETIEGQTWTGEGITFSQRNGSQFDVSFELSEAGSDELTQLVLRDIDLTLLVPEVPEMARGNQDLTRWFLTEREFNRQRVIFEPGSEHIELPAGLEGYAAEEVSIALTNNCLGAGYWELAVSVLNDQGDTEKIYQGYFTFSRGAYAEIVSWLNPSTYWQQVRNMEGWPGFNFLSGLPFALNELREVTAETAVPVTDLKTEEIIAAKEQIKKANLVVYADDIEAANIRTWEDLRQADLKFQSFLKPGIYDPDRLWDSDFGQLSRVVGAVGRQIRSPLADRSLVEVQVDFSSEAGELRQLIVSGIDWEKVPTLDSADYSDGIYMPLGFGTPFTQSYSDLKENPPALSPFFSVLLDGENQVINYRQDIGINGLVMHRDIDNPDLLHLYLMSYERITLVGHYVIDLDLYRLP